MQVKASNNPLVGGIEAGGTKFVCAIGTGPDDIRDETRFATSGPEETLSRAIEFFTAGREKVGDIAAIGIGSFGPVDPDPLSANWGKITETPKRGWEWTDVAGTVKSALGIPVAFDTDVNGAAFGEYTWGAAAGLDTFIYLTVGTGVGGGGMAHGKLLRGLMHPEMGHISVPRSDPSDDFAGICKYHNDCLEGLASGAALRQRWGLFAEEMDKDHPGLALEASYLADALSSYIFILSPQRIILGGGVMSQTLLFPMVREKLLEKLAGYIAKPEITEQIDEFVVPPMLGGRAGVLGAIALAQTNEYLV